MVRDLAELSGHVGDVTSFPLNRDKRPTAEAVAAFQRDGVVCIRQAIGPEWLDLVESGIDAAKGRFENEDTYRRDGDAGKFSYHQGAWTKVESIRRFIFDSHAPDLAWPFLSSRYVIFFYENTLIKEPHSDHAETPWHQDHPYYPLDGTKVINCWTALDSIPVETSLRFLKGSHNSSTVYRTVNFDDPESAYSPAPTELPANPDIDNDPTAEILTAAMEPGDMLVWSSRTFHSAPGNTLDRRRAAISLNWVGDDVVYNAQPSVASYRHESLRVGQSIACEKFPIVRNS
jgi:ectoine hydroxylase-related dioxygenase (phytanoyl-CoA dioxygenase family)